MYSIRAALLLVLMLVLLPLSVSAQQNPELSGASIVINLPSRTLELYSHSSLIKVYPIAIGKPSTPSPTGDFYIRDKEVNPWWYPPRKGYAVPPGPDNPLGYRWMEFTPLYGIHGTNAPWAIGSAVSNGCIRMHEENAEELFELVTYGTPVKVTYERAKIRIDAKGEASIGIYPDVYGWQEVSLQEVKDKLQAYGLAGYLSDEEIVSLIQEEADCQIMFARLHTIRINGKMLAENAVTFKEILYVPVRAVASALGTKAEWDEQTGMVRGARRIVPGRVIGGQVFVTAADALTLYGGYQEWKPEENCLDIDMISIFLNGRSVPSHIQIVNGILAVPVIPLADEIGQKVVHRPDGEYWVQGKKVPVTLVGDIPYIQITQIYDVFRTYVYWNQGARCIELTYPFRIKDGRD